MQLAPIERPTSKTPIPTSSPFFVNLQSPARATPVGQQPAAQDNDSVEEPARPELRSVFVPTPRAPSVLPSVRSPSARSRPRAMSPASQKSRRSMNSVAPLPHVPMTPMPLVKRKPEQSTSELTRTEKINRFNFIAVPILAVVNVLLIIYILVLFGGVIPSASPTVNVVNTMYVNRAGSVGINTVNPQAILEVRPSLFVLYNFLIFL